MFLCLGVDLESWVFIADVLVKNIQEPHLKCHVLNVHYICPVTAVLENLWEWRRRADTSLPPFFPISKEFFAGENKFLSDLSQSPFSDAEQRACLHFGPR